MDDDEDFQALFFIECEENLSDLQTRLDQLLAGDRDPETVNAAFRAVHSVKGGAAAFGFMSLVGFAHDFETVMDRVRSASLELTPEVCEVLLRSGDVMAGLVEATRNGENGPVDRVARVSEQLAALLDAGAAPAPAAAAPEAAPVPEASPPEAAPADPDALEEALCVTVLVAPRPDFLLAGFDPARIIRAARVYGLISVAVEGIVPPIGEYTPGDCPLAWRMEFELDGPLDAFETFLMTYAYGADITLTTPSGETRVEPNVGAVDSPAPITDAKPAPAPAPPEASAPDAAAPPEAAAPAPRPKTSAAKSPAAPAPARPAEAPVATTPAARRVPAADAPTDGTRGAQAASRSLRVDLDRVDRLVNLVGEVLIAQAAVAQGVGETEAPELVAIKPLVETLTRQTRELQESVMAIRAQPVRSVFARLPRVVRDLSDALGKEVRLVMQGEDVEVDTTVIEELTEPLMHMIRNAMDHGVEAPDLRQAAGKSRQGTLTLSAEQRGGRVRIILSDDGKGIDREAVLGKARAKGLVAPDEILDAAAIESLIFHPGFSTAATISAVSGRGVGMDVVRRKIQMLSGRCVVAGDPGKGTTFTITLPLTLAVMDGMAIRVGDQQFILPLSSVVEAITVAPQAINRLPDSTQVLKLRDDFLPVYSLRTALSLPETPDAPSTAVVVDTETNGHIVVLVDDLLGQRQVVLKSLEGNVGQIEGVGGATILGDGNVALVLDVAALFRLGARSAGDLERV
jgi:two-component system, chemotaxis family, sensor kinase CheA